MFCIGTQPIMPTDWMFNQLKKLSVLFVTVLYFPSHTYINKCKWGGLVPLQQWYCWTSPWCNEMRVITSCERATLLTRHSSAFLPSVNLWVSPSTMIRVRFAVVAHRHKAVARLLPQNTKPRFAQEQYPMISYPGRGRLRMPQRT